MKSIARLCLLSPLLLTPLTSLAQTQEIDPYELYKAAQKQKQDKAAEPQIIIPEDLESRTETETVTAPDAGQIDISADEIAPSAEAPQILSVENPQDAPEDEPENIEDIVDRIPTGPVQSLETAGGVALPAPSGSPANTVDTPALNRADIAPFFLTAAEYIDLRDKGAAAPQMNLIYAVTQSGASEGSDPKSFDVALAVGTDYVARQSTQPGTPLQIFDFKFNRVLTVTGGEENAQLMWVNAPLYALAHRNTRTVSGTLKDAEDGAIQIAPDVTLNTFWVESAYSLGLSKRDDLVLSSSAEGGALKLGSETVFEVSLSADTYETPEQSDAMLAFAHLGLPVHPAGLKQLYAAGPVEAMTIISKSPGAPDGQKQVWTLKTASADKAEFPLPPGALNALSETQNDPIAYVMNQAARGTAPGGPPKYDDLADAVLTAMDADDFETAWLAAKRYELFSRPCKKNNIRKACKAMRAIEDKRKKPQKLETLLNAYADSEEGEKRVSTLKALRPWLEADDTPADIMRLAGVLRAKIDASTAKAAGVDDINAGTLIKSALLKDPYNPQMYLAMAQFYAASGDYDAAWNSFDTLRSSVEPNEKAKFAVDKVEGGLQERAPGYFIPAVMAER